MSAWTIPLLIGLAFGYILVRTRVNTFEAIAGFAMARNLLVPKVIATAVAVGSVILLWEVRTGAASWHIKPFPLAGIAVGGIVFGVGMAILGYCPGTLIVSLGEGRLDTLAGIAGGLAAGALFIRLWSTLSPLLGPELGKIRLGGTAGGGAVATTIVFALLLLGLAFLLDRFDPAGKD